MRRGGFLHTGKPGAISWKDGFHVVTETDTLGVLMLRHCAPFDRFVRDSQTQS
ncbi:rCG25418, partial [Rattus norvegicus]